MLTTLVKAELEPEQNPPQSRLGLSSQVYSHPLTEERSKELNHAPVYNNVLGLFVIQTKYTNSGLVIPVHKLCEKNSASKIWLITTRTEAGLI